jgi:hypothetical protein
MFIVKVAIKQLTPMVNDKDKLKDFHDIVDYFLRGDRMCSIKYFLVFFNYFGTLGLLYLHLCFNFVYLEVVCTCMFKIKTFMYH